MVEAWHCFPRARGVPTPSSPSAARSCAVSHGSVPPLWRPTSSRRTTPSASTCGAAEGLPTYLPWPMSPGWRVSDFGVVGEPSREPRATVSACSGPSDLDGPVDVLVVTEEPGTGLGARCAGLVSSDPGPEVGLGPAMARVRVGGQPVSLWPVSTAEADPAGDRTVLAGEAFGRWLWLVLQPASALLLLRDEWQLRGRLAGRPAAGGAGVRRASARSGDRPLQFRSAHRPPHPLRRQRRDADARRRWCGRPPRPGIDVLGLTDHDTAAGLGGRRGRRAGDRPDAGAAAWRSAPGTPATASTCSPTCADPTYPPLVTRPGQDPRRPQLPGARDPGAAARPGHRHRRRRRTPGLDRTPGHRASAHRRRARRTSASSPTGTTRSRAT